MVIAAARPGLRQNFVSTGPFVPTQIAGCDLWLDAGQITGSVDGAAVATWQDRSGNARNATQATVAKQPTFRSTGVNLTPTGKPVVQFDGVGTFLDTVVFTVATPISLFFTLKEVSNAGGTVYYDSPTAAATTDIYHNAGATALNGETGTATGASTTVADTSFHTFSSMHGTTASSIFRDGVSILAYGGAAQSSAGYRLGASRNAAGFLNGVYAEFIAYNRTLTTGERQQVEGYLTTKHGTP